MHLQLPRTPSSDDRHHQPAPTRPPLLSPSTPRRSLSLSRTPAHACMPRAPNLCDAPPLLLHGTAASLTDDSPSLQRPLAGLRGSAETEMGLDAVRHALSTYDDPPVRLRVSRLSDLSSTVLLIRRPSHTILARMARGGRPGRGCAGGALELCALCGSSLAPQSPSQSAALRAAARFALIRFCSGRARVLPGVALTENTPEPDAYLITKRKNRKRIHYSSRCDMIQACGWASQKQARRLLDRGRRP